MDSHTVSLPAFAFGFFQFKFIHYRIDLLKTKRSCPYSKVLYDFLLPILPISQFIGNWVVGGSKEEV